MINHQQGLSNNLSLFDTEPSLPNSVYYLKSTFAIIGPKVNSHTTSCLLQSRAILRSRPDMASISNPRSDCCCRRNFLCINIWLHKLPWIPSTCRRRIGGELWFLVIQQKACPNNIWSVVVGWLWRNCLQKIIQIGWVNFLPCSELVKIITIKRQINFPIVRHNIAQTDNCILWVGRRRRRSRRIHPRAANRQT